MIWNQRAGSVQAVTVAELYDQIESFLTHLKTHPATVSQLEQQSQLLTQELPRIVHSASSQLSLLHSQNVTLEALSFGMIRGASDGSLLFQHRVDAVPQTPIQFEAEHLHSLSETLLRNLSQITDVAGEKWLESHPDDLYLLCAYAKHENQSTLQEGGAVAQQCAHDMFEFQRFLMATFKGGFATGLIQAAVTVLGDES